jgi:hypothetical protein
MDHILYKLLEQVPAFGALCIVVVLGARHLQKDRSDFMEFMKETMVQIRELSVTCHTSHKEVADSMTGPLGDNTKALQKMEITMGQMTLLLERVNGKLAP